MKKVLGEGGVALIGLGSASSQSDKVTEAVNDALKNPLLDDVDEFETRIHEELERKPPFSVADLEIDGNELMELFHIPESPQIGEILSHLLDLVLDDPEKNRKEVLIEAVKGYLHTEETR